MRALVPVLLLLATMGGAFAAEGGPTATLDITIGADHAESMTLAFEGLARLTRYHGLCLPEGARESRVRDDIGDVPYEATEENGRRVLSFTARSPLVTVEMARAGPSDAERPLYANDVNFCVPANTQSTIRVTVPSGHTLFFLSDGGSIVGRTGTITRSGAVHAFYTYEAPLPANADVVVFDASPFRVFVPASNLSQAREVIDLAREPFREAALESGLPMPFDKMRILYAPGSEQSWEAGHYDGRGFVTIRADTLVEDPTQGYPFAPVKVVVHESFHALSFPYGKGRVEEVIAWWLEGTARHAESHVRLAMPNATRYCTTEGLEARCWDFDDRISRASLDQAYAPGFTFEQKWEPKLAQTDETRTFYYALSEFVVAAWIERHGVEAYRAAYAEMVETFGDDARCPCAEGWLVGVLTRAAGEADDDLFTPWADVKATHPSAFAARVEPFVKDEAALQRELDARAKAALPAMIPGAGLGASLAALAALALLRRR